MRALSIAFVMAVAAMTVSGHVGTDHDGNKYSQSYYEEYMMCGKCTYGGQSTTATKNWYKLVCDSAATNSSKWGTLHYECNSGCGTCGKTSAVTMGTELDALYKSGLYSVTYGSYSYKYLMYPASVQCCPQIIQEDKFADTTCSGTATQTKYSVAGCSNSKNITNSYHSTMCATDGAAPSSIRMTCTSDSYLKGGDECPTTHKDCLLTISDIKNSPCLTIPAGTSYNGTEVNMTGTTDTSTCKIDGTQQCLRLVYHSYYLSNMTTGTDDISALSCLAANTGTTAGGAGSGASVFSFAAAAVAAIVVALV